MHFFRLYSKFRKRTQLFSSNIIFCCIGYFVVGTKCGKPNCPAYDTKEKVLRHINYFQYSTYLHCRVPRVKCSNCGVLQIRVPWARELSHFTLQMEATILELAKKMPVLQAGNFLGEEDKKLWRVIHHYVDEARSKEDFSCL